MPLHYLPSADLDIILDDEAPVLKLFIPTQGQATLEEVHEDRVLLALVIFHGLANPKLGLKSTSVSSRLDSEQVFWRTGDGPPSAAPRVQVFRDLTAQGIVFYFQVLDPSFNLDLAITNTIVQQQEKPSASQIGLVTSQGFYVDRVTKPHVPGGELDVAVCTLLDLADANNPVSLANLLKFNGEVPASAQVIPPLFQHPSSSFIFAYTPRTWLGATG
jgi:hypothetical protein